MSNPAKNVFQFLDLPRNDPEKVSVEVRVQEFKEIYKLKK